MDKGSDHRPNSRHRRMWDGTYPLFFHVDHTSFRILNRGLDSIHEYNLELWSPEEKVCFFAGSTEEGFCIRSDLLSSVGESWEMDSMDLPLPLPLRLPFLNVNVKQWCPDSKSRRNVPRSAPNPVLKNVEGVVLVLCVYFICLFICIQIYKLISLLETGARRALEAAIFQ